MLSSFLDRRRLGVRRAVQRADPRSAAVTVAAILASFGAALAVEHLAHLRVDTIVLAVALGMTLGRTQRNADWLTRRTGLVVLPVVAALATEVARLIAGPGEMVGGALFVLAMSATIWVRRFGPRAAKTGTLAMMPMLTIVLITPASPAGSMWSEENLRTTLWAAVVAVLTFVVVTAIHLVAHRIGLIRPAVPRPAAAPRAAKAVAPGASAVTRFAAGLPVSTTMAIQMGVSLAIALVVGHVVLPEHWSWVVLTAFIVCSGNRGRGDVVHKSALRIIGAGVGTLVATGLFGLFGSGNTVQVVAIFVVLAIGTLLRPVSYAYWAVCVTAAMAFLLSYFGETGPNLLVTRLGGILMGGVIGVTACWFVLPIKSTDVARRRVADVLAALDDLLKSWREHPDQIEDPARLRFEDAVGQFDEISASFEAARRVTQRWRTGPVQADVFDALRHSVGPVRMITEHARREPAVLADPAIAELIEATATTVSEVRRSLADPARPGPSVGDIDVQLAGLAHAAGQLRQPGHRD
jgi:uncharacterized membrane protein YgaE (UPF0421/DUF939 family)